MNGFLYLEIVEFEYFMKQKIISIKTEKLI